MIIQFKHLVTIKLPRSIIKERMEDKIFVDVLIGLDNNGLLYEYSPDKNKWIKFCNEIDEKRYDSNYLTSLNYELDDD